MPFRLKSQNRAGIAYFQILPRGTGPDSFTVNLGAVGADTAALAVARLDAAEISGRLPTFRAMYAVDRPAAIEWLLSAQHIAAALAPAQDWRRATVADWFPTFAAHRKATAPATWKTSERNWIKLLLPAWGAARLCEIDPRDFRRWVNGLTKTRDGHAGEPLSGSYKMKLRASLQAMLDHYWDHKHMPARIRLGDAPIKGSTQRVNKPRAALTLAEVTALLAACAAGTVVSGGGNGATRTLSGMHRALFGLAAGCGLRPSEAMRARWEDIDFAAGSIVVRQTKTTINAGDPIPLTPLAWEALETWHNAQGNPATGPAFITPYGKPYGSDSGFKRALNNAAHRAGLADADRVTPYQLRHAFASIAAASGVPEEVTQRVMRHSDNKMLRAHYARPGVADYRRHFDRFDAAE